jgi:hypothetical protein
MLAILKVFDIGLRSSVQARKRPRFCMTIITPRATTGILESTKSRTHL